MRAANQWLVTALVSRTSGPGRVEREIPQRRPPIVALSIATKPNWGDFKAFTTLARREATLLRADTAAMRITVRLDDQEIELEIGGPEARFTEALARREPRPMPMVRWHGIWIVGVPMRAGHALFRARPTDDVPGPTDSSL